MFFEHLLGPNGGSAIDFCQLLSATLAHESTEVDDGVRGLGHFAVEAPLVVGIFHELLQVRGQFWV